MVYGEVVARGFNEPGLAYFGPPGNNRQTTSADAPFKEIEIGTPSEKFVPFTK